MNKIKSAVLIPSGNGLHLRPASLIVKLTQKYQSIIMFIHDSREFNAKSIIEILQIGPVQNRKLELIAIGPDADKAVENLQNLFESNELKCEE